MIGGLSKKWESTLAACLQPEVAHTTSPWPEPFRRALSRIRRREDRPKTISASYATGMQTVMNALNDMTKANQWIAAQAGSVCSRVFD